MLEMMIGIHRAVKKSMLKPLLRVVRKRLNLPEIHALRYFHVQFGVYQRSAAIVTHLTVGLH